MSDQTRIAGYAFAVDMAISWAFDHEESRYYEGMADGLRVWAAAATEAQWKTDRHRIKEAREAAKKPVAA